jgi:hypothetical protein
MESPSRELLQSVMLFNVVISAEVRLLPPVCVFGFGSVRVKGDRTRILYYPTCGMAAEVIGIGSTVHALGWPMFLGNVMKAQRLSSSPSGGNTFKT